MKVRCEDCEKDFDNTKSSTMCPHNLLVGEPIVVTSVRALDPHGPKAEALMHLAQNDSAQTWDNTRPEYLELEAMGYMNSISTTAGPRHFYLTPAGQDEAARLFAVSRSKSVPPIDLWPRSSSEPNGCLIFIVPIGAAILAFLL